MANCVCYLCKRPMDCTGEDLCDLCEYDRDEQLVELNTENVIWLSTCCNANVSGTFSEGKRNPTTLLGFCGQCGQLVPFYRIHF
jgi:hypothetical protein